MAKSLNSKKDQQASSRLGQDGGADYLKLDVGDNYIMLMSPDYEDGKKHFLKVEHGNYTKVVTCNHSLLSEEDQTITDKGDACSGCAHVSNFYAEAKLAKEDMDEDRAKKLRTLAFTNRANYSAVFKAVKGFMVYGRPRADGEEPKSVPSFEGQPVQKWGMDNETYDKIMAIISSSHYPNITMGDHLVGYILKVVYSELKSKNQKTYNKITKVIPVMAFKGNLSIFQEAAELMDLSSEFKVTENVDIDKMLEQMSNGATEQEVESEFKDTTDLDDFSEDDLVNESAPVTKKKTASKKKPVAKKSTAKKKKAPPKKKPVAKKKAAKKPVKKAKKKK